MSLDDQNVAYTKAEAGYFEKGVLRRAGALHLCALGIAVVIYGDFSARISD